MSPFDLEYHLWSCPAPLPTENLIDVILAGCQNGIDMLHKEGKKAGRRVMYFVDSVPFPAPIGGRPLPYRPMRVVVKRWTGRSQGVRTSEKSEQRPSCPLDAIPYCASTARLRWPSTPTGGRADDRIITCPNPLIRGRHARASQRGNVSGRETRCHRTSRITWGIHL